MGGGTIRLSLNAATYDSFVLSSLEPFDPIASGKFTTCLAKTSEGISDAARGVAPVELANAVGNISDTEPGCCCPN